MLLVCSLPHHVTHLGKPLTKCPILAARSWRLVSCGSFQRWSYFSTSDSGFVIAGSAVRKLNFVQVRRSLWTLSLFPVHPVHPQCPDVKFFLIYQCLRHILISPASLFQTLFLEAITVLCDVSAVLSYSCRDRISLTNQVEGCGPPLSW